MKATFVLIALMVFLTGTLIPKTMREVMWESGETVRAALGIPPTTTLLPSKGARQPLLTLVVSQSYTDAQLVLERSDVAKYLRHGRTLQSLYFSNTSHTIRITANLNYCGNAQEAQKELFGFIGMCCSLTKEALVANINYIEDGPGDVCLATRDRSRVLFTRGNAMVDLMNLAGSPHEMLDFARWIDAQFDRLSTDAEALKAADPCETNDTPFAKFIVYDCPEPEVEPLPDTAE